MAVADRRLPAPNSLAWRSSSCERGRRAAAGAGWDVEGSVSGGGGGLANAGLLAAEGGGLARALWRSHWPAAICHRAGGGGFFGGPDELTFSGLRASIRLVSVTRAQEREACAVRVPFGVVGLKVALQSSDAFGLLLDQVAPLVRRHAFLEARGLAWWGPAPRKRRWRVPRNGRCLQQCGRR